MTIEICTCCETPHSTADWYVVEDYHPREGRIECRAAQELRIGRETRPLLVPDSNQLGHITSKPPRSKRLAV